MTLQDKGEWHSWFAWYPVRTIHGNIKFLSFILRKYNNNWTYGEERCKYWKYQ